MPVWDGHAWQAGPEKLILFRDTLAFWTEHSERNWLVSILALLGVQREKRDFFVGRWRVVTASDEYAALPNTS